MNWWRIAKSERSVEQSIKDRICSSLFFAALFKKHDVKIADLDELEISTDKLDKAHCMTGDDKIIIDTKLVKSNDIIESKFHYIAHEILHWLKDRNGESTKKVEKQPYFADPEEVESFNTAIAYSLYEEMGLKSIKDEFLPLIMVTIKDEAKARSFLLARIKDARALLTDIGLRGPWDKYAIIRNDIPLPTSTTL